jgi:putative ABC transport system substrate-binding protein
VIERRSFARGAGLLWLLARLPAVAQPANRLPRVARISVEVPLAEMVGPDPINAYARAFVHGLRDLGWVDGRNVIIEHRSAEGRPERLPALVREVVDLRVEVIVTGGSQTVRAARQATDTIPIVAIGPDLVALGLANSLARPGGNVTGLPFFAGPSMFAKRLELLKRAAPTVKRIAYLSRAPAAGQPMWGAETAEAARALGLVLSGIAVDRPEDFDSAFAAMSLQQPDAILATDTPVNLGNRARIGEFAARERLPAIYGLRQFPEAGGLMSYGIHIPDIQRRAAQYVDKILKGAKPGELPIELPTRFELVINLKTAKALGLTIPKVLLLQADEVIQ